MSDQAQQTPLIELARSVPKDLRAQWETQWFEDGTPCGHKTAPVGLYLHDMADQIEALQRENERLKAICLGEASLSGWLREQENHHDSTG